MRWHQWRRGETSDYGVVGKNLKHRFRRLRASQNHQIDIFRSLYPLCASHSSLAFHNRWITQKRQQLSQDSSLFWAPIVLGVRGCFLGLLATKRRRDVALNFVLWSSNCVYFSAWESDTGDVGACLKFSRSTAMMVMKNGRLKSQRIDHLASWPFLIASCLSEFSLRNLLHSVVSIYVLRIGTLLSQKFFFRLEKEPGQQHVDRQANGIRQMIKLSLWVRCVLSLEKKGVLFLKNFILKNNFFETSFL